MDRLRGVSTKFTWCFHKITEILICYSPCKHKMNLLAIALAKILKIFFNSIERLCVARNHWFIVSLGADDEKLNNLNELPEDEFRPAFLEKVHRFIKCALASSPVKVVNQVEITGHRKYWFVSC